MLMVIFGAGASYDSSPDFPPPQPRASVATQNFGSTPAPHDPREVWRPPLATELFRDPNGVFGDIVANHRYRKLLPILPRLRHPSKGRSVEQELEYWQAEADADPERKRQLFTVRYYLHDLLQKVSDEWLKQTSGVTNYVTLLDQIRHRNPPQEVICLVTFNYDLLLDRALFSFAYMQRDPDNQHLAHPVFKLFKPHGSVDWARYVDAAPNTRLAIEQVIEQADSIKLTKEYRLADATDPRQMFTFGRPIVPAIAIPVQTKTEDTFEWPDSHRAYLKQLLPQVTKILIIGWRGKEAHFLKLLRENLSSSGVTQITHLQAVGRDSTEASDIAKQFIADIDRRVNHLDTATRGFSDFVREEQVGFFFKD